MAHLRISLALTLAALVWATPGGAQTGVDAPEPMVPGLSVGVFQLASGGGVGVSLDGPLGAKSDARRSWRLWAAGLAGGGTGASASVRFFQGDLYLGLGGALLDDGNEVGVGPGVLVGLLLPLGLGSTELTLDAGFEAYLTSAGYAPVLHFSLGRLALGG